MRGGDHKGVDISNGGQNKGQQERQISPAVHDKDDDGKEVGEKDRVM